MALQLAFTGDGTMGMNAGYQDGHSFVVLYDAGCPHDLDERLPQQFRSMEELIDDSYVILNFTCAKSIDNFIETLNHAKAMLEDIESFKCENSYDILCGDA